MTNDNDKPQRVWCSLEAHSQIKEIIECAVWQSIDGTAEGVSEAATDILDLLPFEFELRDDGDVVLKPRPGSVIWLDNGNKIG